MATIKDLPKYPKSSCNTCNDQVSNLNTCASKTNNFGENRQVLNGISYYIPYDKSQGPELPHKPETAVINPVNGLKYSTDYFQLEQDKGPYYSFDPRIKSFATGEKMPLNAPPYTSSIWLQEVYNDKLTGYGRKYGSYNDVNTGQVRYYTTKSLSNPLFKPVFSVRSDVTHSTFVDPMGSVTPNYSRKPVLKNGRDISEYQNDRDEIEFRENLIASQLQSGRYRTEWGMRYNQFQ